MTTGYVLVNCDNSDAEHVIEQLKKIDSVIEADGVFGTYDIIVKVEVDDKNAFSKILSTQIRTIDKLKSTLTLMVSDPDGEFF